MATGAGFSSSCRRPRAPASRRWRGGCAAWDPSIRFSVSATTRAPRAGEVDGADYHFVDRARRSSSWSTTARCWNTPMSSATSTARRKAPVQAAIEAGLRRAVRHRLAGRAADQQLGAARRTCCRSSSCRPRSRELQPPAGRARPGRRPRRSRERMQTQLGRDQPLGRLRLRAGQRRPGRDRGEAAHHRHAPNACAAASSRG